MNPTALDRVRAAFCISFNVANISDDDDRCSLHTFLRSTRPCTVGLTPVEESAGGDAVVPKVKGTKGIGT